MKAGCWIANLKYEMCVISNMMLEKSNKKCEMYNRGENDVKRQELTTLANTMVVLGIIFGSSTDRLIGYLFIGAGVVLAIVNALKTRTTITES